MSKIAVLIVTYNPVLSILDDLIGKIKKAKYNLEIFLVDNASENSNILKVKYKDESNILYLDENMGLAGAQNAGLKKILRTDCEAVLFFDQDTSPTDAFFTNLIESMSKLAQQGEKIGAIGPVFYDSRTGTKYPFILLKGMRAKKVFPRGDVPLKVSFLINSGMLVPVSTLKDIGLMKEELFIDYVDIEWCLRAASKKFNFYAIPSATMSHAIGDERKSVLGREISIHSPLRRYYLARNSIYMLRLPYVPLGYKIREILFSVLRTVIFISTLNNKKTYINFILKGWSDGIKRNYGKYIGIR